MAKSVKRIALSDEKIFQLIELYRERGCLWNIKLQNTKIIIATCLMAVPEQSLYNNIFKALFLEYFLGMCALGGELE
ncbi:hypothetical protein NQ317_017525 [Molorchus minor]|uniref:Uncharacterized protein n=1 Tax=Molorchus minor TaxID=1323400 RepID=A0ABQ9JPQ6_9CUCU|nr:hypothetical protein NQ317_017525 [Molorchus minor]